MSKYPLLSNEVKINKIGFSCINYNDNKQYCYINYENQNESLYLQTPFFKFIEPIGKSHSNGKTYDEIYLFLTPQDPTTFTFIELINSLETKVETHVNSIINKSLNIVNFIKTSELDEDMNSNQVIKYLKIKLLDQTKIEYNNDLITIGDLNKLVSKVNLKLIFEINMIWFNSAKIGLYLKPIKIKAIDILPEVDFEFRDDNNESLNDLAQTEYDNIRSILNNQSLMSLNESVFNQDKNTKKSNKSPKQTVSNNNTESIPLNAFIPSSGINNHSDLQKQLKNELFVMDNIKQKSRSRESTRKTSINNRSDQNIYTNTNKSELDINSDSISDSEELSNISNESSSSIQVEKYSRKSKNNRSQNVKKINVSSSKTKGKRDNTGETNKSIDKLKKTLSNTSYSDNYTDSLDLDLNNVNYSDV